MTCVLFSCNSSCESHASSARERQPVETPRTTQLQNESEPIILVHGFAGWGRNDIPGFYYWGGFRDLEAELQSAGYVIHTASIGPFSSNWDRACELYAYIAGGIVDYGEAHSSEFGHERFGPTYPGIYPDWNDDDRIHIISHSMGGQTARLFAHLLRHGDDIERTTSENSCSRLFAGGGQRVRSITTLAGPHNGTTIVNDVTLIDTIMHAAIAALATVIENDLFLDFDLKMGHWGISRIENEPLGAYFRRLRNHDVWSGTLLDFSLYDVSVEGASELNKRVKAEPDIYYFSWSNEATTSGTGRRYLVPELTMLPAFMPSGVYLGLSNYRNEPQIDQTWRENDGVVNTNSMRGPFLDSTDTIIDYDGSPEPGVWNYMGVLSSADHADVLGIPNWRINGTEEIHSILELYLYLCDLAVSLP